jgi:hypothetical protein
MAAKAVMASTSCAVRDKPGCAGIHHATAIPQAAAIASDIQRRPGVFARSAVLGAVFESVD